MHRLPFYIIAGVTFLATAERSADARPSKSDTEVASVAIKKWASKNGGVKVLLHDDGNIRSLYVSRYSYTDQFLKHLSGLARLEYLSLNGPEITNDVLKHLEGLNSLKRLNLGSARISDNRSSSTRINGTGLAHLKGLTKLEDLRIATRLRIDDKGVNNIKGLTKLKLLYITNEAIPLFELAVRQGDDKPKPSNSTNITDAGLVHLKAMTQLDHLLLRNTKIRGSGLANLKGMRNLKQLYLHGSPVTDIGVPHLSRLKKLEYLELSGTRVSVQGADEIQTALPECKVAW